MVGFSDSAAIDDQGNYFYTTADTAEGANGPISSPVYMLGRPDHLTGYASIADMEAAGMGSPSTPEAGVLIDTSEAGLAAEKAGAAGFADIASLNWSGQRYVVGIDSSGTVLMMQYSNLEIFTKTVSCSRPFA